MKNPQFSPFSSQSSFEISCTLVLNKIVVMENIAKFTGKHFP